MFTPRVAVLGMMAGALMAAPAMAVTYAKSISQTVNYSTAFTSTTQYTNTPTSTINTITPASFTIAQFNPIGSKGQTLTLQSISISYTSQIGGTITLVNGSGNARNGTLTYQINNSLVIGNGSPISTLTNTVGAGVNIPFTIAAQSQGNLGFGSANTLTTNSFTPPSLTPYIGTGTLTVAQSVANLFSDVTLASGGKGNLRGNANANINGAFTITYNYLDPLPEPQSWAMLITGFGLVGGVMRRQRAQRLA